MNLDMTKGNPVKLIIRFALPLYLSNLFQQFYNLADTAIVGHTLGDQALSAVGSVTSVYGLITSLCFGLTNGFAILISKYYGEKNEKRMRQAIAGTVLLSMISTVVITVISIVLLEPIIRSLHTPAEIYDNALSYIRIIVMCCVVTVFYNMLASILRALGNSRTPLIFLIISSILNIILDLTFIKVFGLGIAGAAWATVLAQGVSGILCLIYIIRVNRSLIPRLEDFKLTGGQIAELLNSGIAMSLMLAVVNIGSLILQSGINSLGADIIAAHIAARKISDIYMMLGGTLAGTMATYSSQNYGAGRMDRVWKGLLGANLLSYIWATVVIIITYLFAGSLLTALTGSVNAEIISTGTKYLRINLPFYYVLYTLCLTRSTLQGIGVGGWTVVASILEMLGKLITVKAFIAPLGYTAVCFCEPVTWIVCGVLVVVVFLTNKEVKRGIYEKANQLDCK